MWFFLNDKSLTWDQQQRRNWEGPGRCNLCLEAEETNRHLAIDCKFTTQVWHEKEALMKSRFSWNGISVQESLKN